VAAAYATMARGGVYRPVTFELFIARGGGVGARPEWACWETLAALADVERVRRVCPAAAGTNAAFKTGTSSDHRDAWCAAVTRRHTVVVWLGNAAGRGTKTLTGLDAAAPLAMQIIAGLGRCDERWPVRNEPVVTPPPPPRTAASLGLVLASPADGTEIIIDADAPRERQRVLLKAAGADDESVWWLIDGRQHAVTRASHEVWWTPAAGRHEVRVVDRNGNTAAATVHVVE
jgi:penicillin-binding protein 1C